MKLATNNLKNIAAVAIAICVASHAMAATDVKLRERVAPRGAVVRLGDVAEVSTADRHLARKLSTLPLMPAPAAGTERFLQAREIQDMLSAQGVDVGALRFVGPARVEILPGSASAAASNVIQASAEEPANAKVTPGNRHAAILAGATGEQLPPAPAHVALDDARMSEIRTQVTSIIGAYLNTKTGKVQAWKVECDLAERDIAKLDAAVSTPTCVGGTEPWSGRQRFVMTFKTADGQVQVPVLAEVSPPPVAAIVAIRPIGRGEVVKAADIEPRMVDVNPKSFGQHAPADSVEKLIGMEARQAIQAGDIVFTDQVQPPIVVKRGDVITVTSQSGGIRVRTSGKAMQDAARGELVQVEAIGSRAKYDARVVGPREAAVFAISRPAAPEPVKHADTARRNNLRLDGATGTKIR